MADGKDKDQVIARVRNSYGEGFQRKFTQAYYHRAKALLARAEGHYLQANGVHMGRPPATPTEVAEGWEGVVRLMNHFGQDKDLAARTLGVSRITINRMIQKGYVPVYIAVLAHHKCDTLEFEAWGLVPYLAYEGYDWQWAHWLESFDAIEKELARRRAQARKTLKPGPHKKKAPDARPSGANAHNPDEE